MRLQKTLSKCSAAIIAVDIPETNKQATSVEVQFKNTRKGYFLNSNNLKF